jgi:hypothetical protein
MQHSLNNKAFDVDVGEGWGLEANGKERSNFRQRKRSKEVNENVRNKTKIKLRRELQRCVGTKGSVFQFSLHFLRKY